MAQVWALTQLWYHDRLSVGFHGRTAQEAETVFRAVGLTSEFWHMPREA